jgi:small subunit ribosomal protein S6
MLNHYETVFILTPVLSDEQVKEAVQKFKDYLQKEGVELVHEENWGLRKLAYKLKNKSTGFYQLFEYKMKPELVKNFEIQLRRDERIMRFQTVKLDQFGIAFNIKRRAKATEVQGTKPIIEKVL